MASISIPHTCMTDYENIKYPNENHDFYFTYHHTAGDSMWMMNPEDMDDNIVVIASIMYLIADYDGLIPKD